MINHKSVITFYACISILAFFTMINATSASIAINKIAIIASTFSIYRVERCRTFITLTRRFTGSTMLCTISTWLPIIVCTWFARTVIRSILYKRWLTLLTLRCIFAHKTEINTTSAIIAIFEVTLITVALLVIILDEWILACFTLSCIGTDWTMANTWCTSISVNKATLFTGTFPFGIGFERFLTSETSLFITFDTMWPTGLTNLFLLVESIYTFAVGSIFNKVVVMITNFAMIFILASETSSWTRQALVVFYKMSCCALITLAWGFPANLAIGDAVITSAVLFLVLFSGTGS